MSMLLVTFNGEVVLEYDKQQRLPGKQREFLDRMDVDMDAGLVLRGVEIQAPDAMQRAGFVAMQLIRGIQAQRSGPVRAACAWLASRTPTLCELRVHEEGEELTLELLFEDGCERRRDD